MGCTASDTSQTLPEAQNHLELTSALQWIWDDFLPTTVNEAIINELISVGEQLEQVM